MRKKVALYYPWIYLTSGAERSILELVRRSRHDWTIFTNHYDSDKSYPEFKSLKVVELERVSVERSFSKVMQAGLKIAKQKLDLKSFDALLVVCEGLGDMVVFRNHCLPVICLCLTPLRPVYDPVYRATYLKGKGRSARLALSVFGAVFSIIDRMAWKYYRKVICISRETHNRVLAGKLTDEAKLSFAFPGIDYKKFAPTGHFSKYFFIPGRIMWTKNIELGIRAFQRFQKECPAGSGFTLIVAGIVDKKSQPYYDKLRNIAGEQKNIEFIIHPDDATLFDLYDRSYAVLYTPFNEDWGMVPLEAMAFGKPVVAVNRGGPLETIEHGRNGFLSEPKEEDFAAYMAELVLFPDKARLMGEEGRSMAKQYDWEYFVETIDEVVKDIF